MSNLDGARDEFIEAASADADAPGYNASEALKEAVQIEAAARQLRLAIEVAATALDGFYTGAKPGREEMINDAVQSVVDSFGYDVSREAAALFAHAMDKPQ